MDGLNGNLGNNVPGGNMNGDDNANRNAPLAGVRERLFHALFFRLSLSYARIVPASARRIIEFVALIKAVLAFFILIYVHITFIHKPTTCLSHLQKTWPRDGILRVEILRNGSTDYSIENSYARERKIREQRTYEMNLLLTSFKLPFEWFGDVQIESSLDDDTTSKGDDSKKERDENMDSTSIENLPHNSTYNVNENNGTLLNSGSWSDLDVFESVNKPQADHFTYDEFEQPESLRYNKSWINSSIILKDSNEVQPKLLDTPSEVEKFVRAVWPDEEYIIEFSLEYGFLRLSPKIRQKLNIPVKVVTLNPNTDACFGDSIMRYILEYIIGYDDLLMLSIKTLAEKENDKGFLRNVVTGELYRFVTLWMSRASYISAFAIMLAFTLSISMLLRYSHHQIFMFIVNLLQTAEFNSELTVPAAPLFTVILALIGMEAIMSEFFNDSTTAFYIIIIVWIADQYEAICCQRAITKKHWMKFFYLYQFSFYAYHYRFNGQYSGLALVTSWLFIQHSMIYFFHHYELPMILRRYQLQQFLLNQQASNSNSDPVAFLSTNADLNINNNNNNNNNINHNNNNHNNNSTSNATNNNNSNTSSSSGSNSNNYHHNQNRHHYNVEDEQFRLVTLNEDGGPQAHPRARRFSLLFSVLRTYRRRFGHQLGSNAESRNTDLTARIIVTRASNNQDQVETDTTNIHTTNVLSSDNERRNTRLTNDDNESPPMSPEEIADLLLDISSNARLDETS